MQNYIKRKIEPFLLRSEKTFPALILTGPRQSGKTTTIKTLFSKTHTYLSLDDPDLRVQAVKDPKFFLTNFPPPVIIDEVQYAPELFPYLKIAIDQNRQKNGQFILTGSQLFPLMAGGSESLAGRGAGFYLLPLSLTEIINNQPNLSQLKTFIFSGGWPALNLNQPIDHKTWFNSYVQTYLERDIRQLKLVADLTDFQRLLQLAAANNGQIINLSSLANDLGVAVNTIKSWFSVLEASGQIALIKPYYKNRGKRLIKSPKLYFLDTGVLCHLLGLSDAGQVFTGPFSGSHLETLVLTEIYKAAYNRGALPKTYFWRTSAQQEVDFIIEKGAETLPVEIKLSAKLNLTMVKSLVGFIDLFKLKRGFILNLNEGKNVLTDKVVNLSLFDFIKELK